MVGKDRISAHRDMLSFIYFYQHLERLTFLLQPIFDRNIFNIVPKQW